MEKLKVEGEEKSETIKEAEEKMAKIEMNYQQEIKQLSKSISGLREESPIMGKGREDDINTIMKL
jgi:predicted nuclease with TOPRIM domain